LCWGPDNQDAEGAEILDAEGVEEGRECGGGIPLPSRLEGLGERRKLLQRGPGQSPGRKRVLEYLELKKHT